jgi:hypothetical protein
MVSANSPADTDVCGIARTLSGGGATGAAWVGVELRTIVVSLRLVSRALSDACSITTLQPNDATRAAIEMKDLLFLGGRKSRFLASLGMTTDFRARHYARIAPDRAFERI